MSLGRARVWHQLGELELAAVDCSVAIQVLSHKLKSNELAADARNASKILAVCYAQRAICWLILKRKHAAVADLEHAYRLDPTSEFAHKEKPPDGGQNVAILRHLLSRIIERPTGLCYVRYPT